jgi:hypothetical protein
LSDTSTQQIGNILEKLPLNQQHELIKCLEGARQILSPASGNEIAIRPGKPGDLGYIAYRHSV